jgi:hypothetical protein
MLAFLHALLRAIVITVVVFGPALAMLRLFSWRSLVGGAVVMAAYLVYAFVGLSGPSARMWNVTLAIIGALVVTALWLTSAQWRPRPLVLLGAYVALVILGVGLDHVRISWYHVAHPGKLAAYLDARERLRQVARGDYSSVDTAAMNAAAAERRAIVAAQSVPIVIPPVIAMDSAGRDQVIPVDSLTDVMWVEAYPRAQSSADPTPWYVLSLFSDPAVLALSANRRRILIVPPEIADSMGKRHAEIWRHSPTHLQSSSGMRFYNRTTGQYDLWIYPWLVKVLGMDRAKARELYIVHMRRPPNEDLIR